MQTTIDDIQLVDDKSTVAGTSLWRGFVILLSLILSIPILTVFASVLIPNHEVWRHLSQTVLADYVINSFLLMVGVGLLTFLIGVVNAWLVTMCRFPGSRVFEWALLLPMSIPAYIIAYTYTGVLDVGGPIQIWLRDFFALSFGEYWFPEVRSLGGAICMLSLVLYPYVYLLTRAAFIEQSICVLEVSRSLGCGPFRSFFRVALPLARPAIIVGLSLVLMETLADYGTVQYFGLATFTTGIFRTWFGLGNSVAAAQLSALLMVFVIVLIFLEQHSRSRARYFHTSSKYSNLPKIYLTTTQKFFAYLICLVPIILGFILPVVFLIQWAGQTYASVIDDEFISLMLHSLALAATTAVLAIAIACFMAYGKRRYPGMFINMSVKLTGMGYAFPGTVIAVGVLLPFAWLDNTIDAWFRDSFGISTGLLLSGTLIALVFAYLIRFLAISLNTADAALGKIKPSIDEAAQSMGLRNFALLKKIHLPMVRGSLLTASLLVFVDVLKELPATLILRPFNFNTLAVRTYELANEERLADAANPALAIILVGIIPVFLLSRSITKSRPGHAKES